MSGSGLFGRQRRTQIRTANGGMGSILTPLDQEPPTEDEIEMFSLLIAAATEDAAVLDDPDHVSEAVLGEATRKCRTCGCSQYRACAGGCWWVEEDLCSACIPGVITCPSGNEPLSLDDQREIHKFAGFLKGQQT